MYDYKNHCANLGYPLFMFKYHLRIEVSIVSFEIVFGFT